MTNFLQLLNVAEVKSPKPHKLLEAEVAVEHL
jgi:hypothetical protein